MRFLKTTFDTLEMFSIPPLRPDDDVFPTIHVFDATFTLMIFPYASLQAQRDEPRLLDGEDDDLSSVDVEHPFAYAVLNAEYDVYFPEVALFTIESRPEVEPPADDGRFPFERSIIPLT